MSDGKKSLERNALDSFLKDSRNMKGYTIEEVERPDLFLTKMGIELPSICADSLKSTYGF